MQWDDFSFDPGSYGFDASSFGSEYGSSDPSSYAGFSPDSVSSYASGGGAAFDPSQMADPSASIASAGAGGGGLQAPGAQGMVPGIGGLGGLNSIQGLLGIGGGLAGLIGAISSGGVKGTQSPVMGTAQKAQVNQANQAIQPAAMGQLPLQQTQASMLQALASGQIPPGMAQLVQSAYDPAYQDAATRSVNAGRQAGFFDNPLSSPPGGAIMGPAAAQLQGQQANSLLGLIQSLPQLFNQPIGNQIGAAQTQSGNLLNAAQLGTGQQTTQPVGSQIGQGIGNSLLGTSQAIGMNNQQQLLGQILQNQIQGQGAIPGTTSSLQ